MGARRPDPSPADHGTRPPPRPIDRFDPGWLFLIAGLVLLGYTVIIPAQADLAEARWQRDRALAIERQREERLFKHERYLAALESREPSLVRALAASQLNLVPVSQGAIVEVGDPATGDVSVFPGLEPAPIRLPELRLVESRLARWARDDHARLWLIISGGVLVFIGLLGWSPRPGTP
jgi:hypothetical protein